MAKPNTFNGLAETEEELDQMVLEALNIDGTLRGAAAKLGVSERTIWRYISRNKSFRKECRWVLDGAPKD